MNAPMLFYQIALWANGIALFIFLSIEIFWHVRQNSSPTRIPSLILGFFIYNLPFLLLGLSMFVQSIPNEWTGILRLIFLALAIPTNLWLHYHGDKGGNSIGMAAVFFLLAAVPLILIIEIFIAFY